MFLTSVAFLTQFALLISTKNHKMENIFIMYYILYKRRIRPEIGFAKVIHKQCYINIMVVENIKKLLEIYRVLLMSRLFQ